MAQMPSLHGVSREWEQEGDLREHLCRSKELLQWEDDGAAPWQHLKAGT